MKTLNVDGSFRFALLSLSAVILAGCTKAGTPEISFLSLTLPSLKSTVRSPFDQDDTISSSKYVLFAGTCFSTVDSFELQMNDLPWVRVDHNMPMPASGEMAPVNEMNVPLVYDQDCSDGHFQFWVYMHQINDALTALGIGQTVDEYEMQVMRLRGMGGLMPTDPMEFRGHDDGGNGNGPGPATKLSIRQSGMPEGRIRVGQCGEIFIQAVTENGSFAGVAAEERFTLWSNGVEVQTSDSYANCEDGFFQPHPALTVGGPAEARVYYRFNGTPGSIVNLEAKAVNAVLANSSVKQVILRDGLDRYAQMEFPWSVAKDACYPLTFQTRTYDNSITPLGVLNQISLSLEQGNPSDIRAYSSVSDCYAATNGTSIENAIVTYDQSLYTTNPIYLRVSNSTTTEHLKIKLDLPLNSIDGSGQYIHVSSDVGGRTQIVAQIPYSGISGGQCVGAEITIRTQDQTLMPVSDAATVWLSLNGGAGLFYTTHGCSATGQSSVTFQPGQFRQMVYFRAPISGGTYSVSASTAGLTTVPGVFTSVDMLTVLGCSSPILADGGTCVLNVSGGYPPYNFMADNCPMIATVAILQNSSMTADVTSWNGGTGTCQIRVQDSMNAAAYASVGIFRPLVLNLMTPLAKYGTSVLQVSGGNGGPYSFTNMSVGIISLTSTTADSASIYSSAVGGAIIQVCDSGWPQTCDMFNGAVPAP